MSEDGAGVPSAVAAGSQDQGGTGRTLYLEIFRYNPADPDSEPQFRTYPLEETPGMTLFIALNLIREEQEPGLQFDFVCRAGICGSCGMLINGRPGLACRTLTASMEPRIRLAPLPVFELIGDLSVNTGKWMRGMSERLQTWVPATVDADIDSIEAPMEPELAEQIYELERCIECGCCIAGCGTAIMHERFAGAVGLNKVARFRLDPRDTRSDGNYYELIGDDDGIFGCMSLMGCQDVCPKSLPLQTQLAYLRRKMLRAGLIATG
ncbi:fumarate reductase iron-sulfur subunit [Parahaliea maris]|uniref:Succinate dehydrogenase iron-sulfur subunit n=1 Tax=Parahaliea maris TaxID=2716870 RepID=A0A5C9A7Q6_9GAMM|nr:fumarate reductase iron-sulfur subunit [Parahaliea maris]TXS95700.1 fumarate reductase iron-sulfur subunit [Parahaliea maris]